MSNDLHLTVGALDDHEHRISNIEERLDAMENRRRRAAWWPVAAGALGIIAGSCSVGPSVEKAERTEQALTHARDACFELAYKHGDQEHGCP